MIETRIKKFFDHLFYFMDGNIRVCVTIAEKDLAVTANHCIPKDKKEGDVLTIFSQSGKPYEVEIIYQNEELDLALLQPVEDDFEVEPLEVELPAGGEPYFALVGYIKNSF